MEGNSFANDHCIGYCGGYVVEYLVLSSPDGEGCAEHFYTGTGK